VLLKFERQIIPVNRSDFTVMLFTTNQTFFNPFQNKILRNAEFGLGILQGKPGFCKGHRNTPFVWEPVGLRKSKRKFGWARTDFVDFSG